jgi:signal transduction histidine kinase
VGAASGLGAVRFEDELTTEPEPEGAAALGPGAAPRLDPVLSLAVYRIVQESLSNIARHATGADTTVRLARASGAVEVEVSNGKAPGRPAEAPAPVAGGHGLRGMRERAELLGGSLEAGPDGAGGFRVLARLPLRGEGAA